MASQLTSGLCMGTLELGIGTSHAHPHARTTANEPRMHAHIYTHHPSHALLAVYRPSLDDTVQMLRDSEL